MTIHDIHVSEIGNKISFKSMIPPLPTFSKQKQVEKINPNLMLCLMGMKLGVYFSVLLAITHML